MSEETRIDNEGSTRTFEEWQKAVDKVLSDMGHMPADCMADYCSWDTWDSESSPKAGAYECLMAQDFFDHEELVTDFRHIAVDINEHI